MTKSDTLIENRVLGALIALGVYTSMDAQKAFLSLDMSCFSNHERRELFAFIKSQADKFQPFDEISLLSKLPERLTSTFAEVIANGYLTTNLLEHDIKCLKELSLLRKILSHLHKFINFCTNCNELDECMNQYQNLIAEISKVHLSNDKPYIETYEQIIDSILSGDESIPSTIRTELTTWPAFPNSSMITIAGRSGTGKTFLGIYLLEHLMRVLPEKQALYFNLEMQPAQMINRHAIILNGGAQGSATMRQTINEQLPTLLARDIRLITRPAITIEEIETICRIESAKKPVGVIVIDYIGLVKTYRRYDSRHIEQGEIAQRLAGLALDLNCIVLTLLQVNRDHKNRPAGDKAPFPTDAADSTGCERSSYWWLGIDQPQVDSDEPQFKDLFIVKNRKNRGDTGYFTIYMHFKNGCFYEIDQKSVRLRLGSESNKDLSRFGTFERY